jgi:hypothetical protein
MEQKTTPLLPDPRIITDTGTQLFLTITIGNGQIGGNYVKVNGQLVAKGDLSKLHLVGSIADLHGKTINVQTNVMDVNALTDTCIITSTFTNESGIKLFTKTDQDQAPPSGVLSFIGNYSF